MYSRRAVVIVVVGLTAFVPLLAAEEPQPGKVRLVHWLKNADESLAAGGFLADGRLLLEGDNYLRIWNPKSGKEESRFGFKFGKPFTFTYNPSPDGKTVAVYFYNMEKELRLFDVSSGQEMLRLRQTAHVMWPQFAPDGRTLIALSNGLRLWDVKTGKELWRLRLELPEKSAFDLRKTWETHHRLAFSPDGKVLAVALQDGSIHLCDMKTGREVRRLFREVARADPSRLAFSPDGRYLVANALEEIPGVRPFVPNDRFVIRLWDVHKGELVRSFASPEPPLPDQKVMQNPLASAQYFGKYARNCYGLAFSPDGKTLANAFLPTQLWEVATGQLRHEFNAYTYAVCFSPTGRLLAASCWAANSDGPAKADGIRLWDWRDPCLKQPTSLAPREIERLWNDLASADAAVGYRAIAILLAQPKAAVEALGERLRRVEPVIPGEIDRLIADLNADSFSIRQNATDRLLVLGERVRPALLRIKVQRPSLEVRRRVEDLLERLAQPGGGPETLRCVRAVEVLESIGTKEARRAISRLSSGVAGAVETEDAKAALRRLNRRQEGRSK